MVTTKCFASEKLIKCNSKCHLQTSGTLPLSPCLKSTCCSWMESSNMFAKSYSHSQEFEDIYHAWKWLHNINVCGGGLLTRMRVEHFVQTSKAQQSRLENLDREKGGRASKLCQATQTKFSRPPPWKFGIDSSHIISTCIWFVDSCMPNRWVKVCQKKWKGIGSIWHVEQRLSYYFSIKRLSSQARVLAYAISFACTSFH